jgi:hypothetical protein
MKMLSEPTRNGLKHSGTRGLKQETQKRNGKIFANRNDISKKLWSNCYWGFLLALESHGTSHSNAGALWNYYELASNSKEFISFKTQFNVSISIKIGIRSIMALMYLILCSFDSVSNSLLQYYKC